MEVSLFCVLIYIFRLKFKQRLIRIRQLFFQGMFQVNRSLFLVSFASSLLMASLPIAAGQNGSNGKMPYAVAQPDYNGDKKADLAFRRIEQELFTIIDSSGRTLFNSSFGGLDFDVPVQGDFDGDGITDLAVRRLGSMSWKVHNSSQSNFNSQFHNGYQQALLGREKEDIPVVGDYDGDGISDFAVFRPSTQMWYVRNSTASDFNSSDKDGIQRMYMGGTETLIPVPGDYNGDGITDAAVFDAEKGTWKIYNSPGDKVNFNSPESDGIQHIALGYDLNDIPVNDDFDGDGIDDVAVWNKQTYMWKIQSSSTGTVMETRFGTSKLDIPIVADYDGDGLADLALRSLADRSVHLMMSSWNTILSYRVGHYKDIPVNAPSYLVMQLVKDHYLSIDSDNDGISDEDEVELFGSDPYNYDSDGDGISDGDEVYSHFTNPNKADTDGDGLTDSAELAMGTNPRAADTDGDGVSDLVDVFPNDSSESRDTDDDGVGDNGDFYPEQAACYREFAGNGEECYATWLPRQRIQEVTNNGDNMVAFKLSYYDDRIITYDMETQAYRQISIEAENNERLREMEFSAPHNRLYLGFSDGRVSYVDMSAFTMGDVTNTDQSIYKISAIGEHILIQDRQHSNQRHFIFDIDGRQTERVEWSEGANIFAWNDILNRFYFFEGTSSQNSLTYQNIEPASGKISSFIAKALRLNNYIYGPLLFSPDGKKLLLSSGDIYDAETLEPQSRIGIRFDQGVWSETLGIVAIDTDYNSFVLRSLNEDMTTLEVKSYRGQLLDVIPHSEKVVLVVEADSQIQYIEYEIKQDTDEDGVPDFMDPFPKDPAASVDTDNDGAPDRWNAGYTGSEVDPDLTLDLYPLESSCSIVAHATNGICNPTERLRFRNATKTQISGGILYSLSRFDHRINRWDEASQTYLNPIMLTQQEVYREAISILVHDELGVLVGYDSGLILRYGLDGLSHPVFFAEVGGSVQELLFVNEVIVAVHGTSYYSDRDFAMLDTDGILLGTFSDARRSNDYKVNAASNRLYWFRNSWSDSIESIVINQDGSWSDYLSKRYSSRTTAFMSVSPDETHIVTGNNSVTQNYLGEESIVPLTMPQGLSNNVGLVDFVWLDNVAVGLYADGIRRYLGFHSHDLERTYMAVELQKPVHSLYISEGGVVGLYSDYTAGWYSQDVVKYSLDIDADQDGLPLWWESYYGLNDNDATDADIDTDLDNLSNTQEYQNATNPLLLDSDGDGLSDGREVLELFLDPLSVDTDGDSLPDAWEVNNGLNANDATDAQLDADNDGSSNYIEYVTSSDPQDSASVPAFTNDAFFSFEDSAIPAELTLTTGSVSYSTTRAADGDISLTSAYDFAFEWQTLFGDVEVSFEIYSDCDTSYGNRYAVSIDGENVQSAYVQPGRWQSYSVLIPSGFKTLSLEFDRRYSRCDMFVDAIKVRPMPTIYEMGVEKVAKYRNQLRFYDYFDELVRQVEIPDVNESARYATDIAVLDDGRVAVFNGRYRPVLSIYTPESDSWQHLEASDWARNNGALGGVDAIGNKVFVTNMDSTGDSIGGVVVFDLNNNSVEYIIDEDLIDITVGQDGYLYGLSYKYYRNYTLRQYDPESLQLLRSVTIDSNNLPRAIAVDADGNFFVANYYNNLVKFDANGTELHTLEASRYPYFVDIALRDDGKLLISNDNDAFYETTTDLNSYQKSEDRRGAYIDWVPNIDTDADGIPDWWEGAFGLNINDGSDGAADVDGDGLSALQEYQNKTHERNSDTDSDGLTDGREVLDLSLNPLVEDTDGDSMPDLWEVENGLNGSDAGDATVDSDGDGVINIYEYLAGYDPQDVLSVPEVVNQRFYSFEDSQLPTGWSLESGTVSFGSDEVLDGAVSLVSTNDVTFEWQALFDDVELEISFFSQCDRNYYKSFYFSVDGELQKSQNIEPNQWNTFKFLIPAGYKKFSMRIDDFSYRCQVYMDSVTLRPMQTSFEMGANRVAQVDGRLHFYNYLGELVRQVNVPEVNDRPEYNTADIAILDDGRVAVFNGFNEPVLSVYTPESHSWAHLEASEWSRINSKRYGGIDAIGNRVFASNMDSYQDDTNGIVVFDLDDNSVTYFEGEELIDLTVGYDGFVYGLSRQSQYYSAVRHAIHQYAPDTLQRLKSIEVDSLHGGPSSVAVDANGHWFISTSRGRIVEYDPQGEEVNVLDLALYGSFDIAMSGSGQLVVTNAASQISQTDTRLMSSELITLSADFIDFTPDIDSDADGLPDWWEGTFELNINDSNDANVDHDGDGLSALLEYQNGTHERNADTDGDGLSDGREVSELSLNPLSEDTDGDLMPDAWEVENGLNANNASDASLDSDNDGISNYQEYLTGFDPQDPTSVPGVTTNAFFSFEDSVIPEELTVTNGEVFFSSEQAYDGITSLTSTNDLTIQWQGLFSDVQLEFYVNEQCSRDNYLRFYIDGEREIAERVLSFRWTKYTVLVPQGYRDITFDFDSSNSVCELYIDAIRVAPMPTLYEMGVNRVLKDGRWLKLVDYFGDVVRGVYVPNEVTGNSYDMAVIEDGRIIVANGSIEPQLSIYTPERDSWEHIEVSGWTNSSSLYSRLDVLDSKVFAVHRSDNGDTNDAIIVVDLADNSSTFFELDNERLINVTVGYDGFLYALARDTGGDYFIHRYEPETMQLLGSVDIDNLNSPLAITVDADGAFYVITDNGYDVIKYAQDGIEIDRIEISDYRNFLDIALAENGQILLSEVYDRVSQTDRNLEGYQVLDMRANYVDFVPDVDSDGDGLPDWWEGAFSLNMHDASDAAIDHDNDGLTARQEFQFGTYEQNADTDGDGLSDGYELNTFNSDPLLADTDEDGLSDDEENTQGTNPNSADSDGDSLSDYDELNTHSTNPNLADSDSDGMNDAYEVEFGLDTNADDASLDNDGDALTNLQEQDIGTNPSLADTDRDGLSDYDEVFAHGTLPSQEDSDGDRIPDGWELQNTLDPLNAADASLDSDADNFTHLEEYFGHTQPFNAASYPTPLVWANYQGDASHSGYTAHSLDHNDFAFKWQSTLPWSRLRPVTAANGMIFVSGRDNYWNSDKGVVGIDAATGNITWQLDYNNVDSVNAPAWDNGKVFFQTGGYNTSYIRSVNASTGELHFESAYNNDWDEYLAPTLYDGDIYMGGGYSEGVYLLNGASGLQRWFNDAPRHDNFTPAVRGDYVYAYTTQLDIIHRDSGDISSTLNAADSRTSNYATVLTSEGDVVVNHGGSLTVFDTQSLSIKWALNNFSFNGQPSVANGMVYVTANSVLYALDDRDGAISWSLDTVYFRSNIVVTRTHLFVGDSYNTYAINLETQEEDWRYAATGHLSISDDGTLYIAGDKLVAISLK